MSSQMTEHAIQCVFIFIRFISTTELHLISSWVRNHKIEIGVDLSMKHDDKFEYNETNLERSFMWRVMKLNKPIEWKRWKK